jgi:hypothetical protein
LDVYVTLVRSSDVRRLTSDPAEDAKIDRRNERVLAVRARHGEWHHGKNRSQCELVPTDRGIESRPSHVFGVAL